MKWPQFYFSYLSALKISLTIVVVFHIVFGFASAFVSGNIWYALWGAITSIPQTFLWVGPSVLNKKVFQYRNSDHPRDR